MVLQAMRHIGPTLAIGLLSFTAFLACSDEDESTDSAQQQLCERTCAINFCPSDLPAAECKTQCLASLGKCPTETKAAIECRVALAKDAFACSEDAVTYVPDETLCGDKATGAWKCLMGQ